MLAPVLAIAAAIAVVALAAFLFRKLDRGVDDRDPGGPSVGHAGAMLSALFLLVFAIAIIVPWTTADAARENTYTESQAAVEAYWAAGQLPYPAAGMVQTELRDYVGFVIEQEWRLMASGNLSPEGAARLSTIREQIAGLQVKGADAEEAKAAVLEQVQNLSSSRRQRAADAQATPPTGILVLTVVTGLVVLLFPFMAGARPRGASLVPMLAMAALLGIGIFLTFDIVRVFDGGLAVRPDAFTAALQEFQRISGTS
ncbi:bestrophin-like domain [Acrocarpospora catenulata]|uniref:bestrophin-like domain n=1 Tax=Acrocarpospora catenulata TaxID=2836182 RepID=UPI001BDA12A3|nr:DUF4239 domain-containing protein [Acrocarpospora catenulata]